MKVTHSTQTPAMTITSLYSSMGGIFGLFFGASILSFIELLDFLMRWAIGKLSLKMKHKSDTANSPPEDMEESQHHNNAFTVQEQ